MAIAILPDGSRRELPDGSTVRQLAESIGRGLAKAAVVGRVDDKVVDLAWPLTGEHKVSIVTDKDPIALQTLRHSAAHVMAEAIQRLWPDAKLAYGPALENGFYYDIALDSPISSSDFEKIEAEMRKIVAENRPFSRYDLPPGEGMDRLAKEGNKYKVDNANRAIAGGAGSLSWYVTGQKDQHWEDLCMGPHIPATGRIGAFKVMSVAQSHWHGDIKSDKFQRIYGTAFFDQKQLDEHLKQIDEAKKRDHRAIGPALGLFVIDETVGQGLVLWKPKGAIVRQELQNFIGEHLTRQGYSQVFTPHIGRRELYIRSGHYPYYMASQFPEMRQVDDKARPLLVYLRKVEGGEPADAALEKKLVEEAGLGDSQICGCSDATLKLSLARELSQTGENYLLKPMNCPHHIKIFASEQRSYRDLPIRLAEFGTVYRWEKSGELGGMTRVRGFTQDDAHLFCTEEQVPAEVQGCLELVKIVLGTLGMADYRVRVGLRDPDSNKYVGDAAQWDRAEAACIAAAEWLGVPFTREPGEAAFYGPKIDFVVKDVIGREWQLGTVQVDYQLPQRFELEYTGPDNKPHRPVMIHRAPFGSMERFIGVLIEHFGGAFPLWLSPVQVAVLTVSEKTNEYAMQVTQRLQAAGIRVELKADHDKIGAKVRNALMAKTPFLLTVGEKEAESDSVSVRPYHDVTTATLRGTMPLQEFIDGCLAKVKERWHPTIS